MGMIIPFAGPVQSIPRGWLPCDGRELEEKHHPVLFSVVGRSWGGNATTRTFRLPDLRGLFLRGVDNPTGSDPGKRAPEEEKRFPLHEGGSSGGAVGSFQDSENKQHNHPVHQTEHHHQYLSGKGDGGNQMSANADHWVANFNTTGAMANISLADSGGQESRPQNAYVNFIIWAPDPEPKE
jgi:microcystin-dependent protein